MKRIYFTLGLLLALSTNLLAQSPLPKGMKQFNAGLGFSERGIPVYVGMDFGVHPDISVGAEVNFRRYDHGNHDHTATAILGNGNYHFNRLLKIPSNWDVYAGLNLGFVIWGGDDNDFDDDDDDISGLHLGAQVGARYYFTPKVGLNLEFRGGSTLSDGKIGISVRF